MRDINNVLINMNRLKFFAIVWFAMLVCVGFTSCGDGEKNEPAASLVGKWMATNSYGGTNVWEFFPDGSVTMIYTSSYGYVEVVRNNKYLIKGKELHIDFNISSDGEVDEYYDGSFSIVDDSFTYTYVCSDGQGKWADSEESTLVFIKMEESRFN